MSAQDIESLHPPSAEPSFPQWRRDDASASGPRWHQAGENRFWHDKNNWGVEKNGRWSWLIESDGNWWAWYPGRPPLLWHGKRWWWEAQDSWVMMYDGEPWVYRAFKDWELDGLLEPSSGTKIVYSADGERAALVSPTEGTSLVDIKSGNLLGRWPPAD